MKRTQKLLLLLLAGSLLFSCNGNKEQEKPQPKPEPEKVTEPTVLTLSGITKYTAEPQSIKLSVKCDVTWDVTLADASWAKIVSKNTSGDNAGEVTISLAMNRSQESRKQKVTLKAGTKATHLEIEQSDLSSIINKESVILSGPASSTVTVKFKNPWTVSITEGADWFSVSPTQGSGASSVSVKVTPVDGNVNVGERSGGIEFSIGDEKIQLPVIQGQTDAIIVSVDQFTLDGREQDQVVPTETNVSYTVRIPDEASWISEVKPQETKALNKKDIVLHMAANTTGQVRTGTVYFEKGTVSSAIVIRQAPYYSQMETTTSGIYNASGESVVYRPGRDQIAMGVRNGSRFYRLMDPQSQQVGTLSGLPLQDPQLCDSFDLTVKWESVTDGVLSTKTFPVTVISITETRLWLVSASGDVIILNK